MRFKLLAAVVAGLAVMAACDDGNDARYITPEPYLPAYPGSYWDYSDGSRVRACDYELHRYRESTTSTGLTDECYVPVWDGKYLAALSAENSFEGNG